MNNAERILAVIQPAQSILILTHKRPDGDGIGAMLALYNTLAQEKRVTAYLPEQLSITLQFLPGSEHCSSENAVLEQRYDLIVVVDCASWKRTGISEEVMNNNSNILFIDHHKEDTEELPKGANAVVENKASTTHILHHYFEYHGIAVTGAVATCLLTGLVTDTGGFVHSCTTPEVLLAASNLMRKGANLPKIMKNTIRTKPANIMKLWGRAVSRIQQNPNTGVTYSIITKQDLEECHATAEDLSGVANILASIPKSKYALLLTEIEKNRIKGSLRAETEMNTDVAEIAKHFGGGGHKLASGFEIEGRIVKEGGTWKII